MPRSFSAALDSRSSPEQIVEYTGADFGIRGDGEQATVSLYRQLQQGGAVRGGPGPDLARDERDPQQPAGLAGRDLSLPAQRTMVDNRTYFARGGQSGFETKRGCNRQCLYCADPLAKGRSRGRASPAEIADEIESLLAQGIDVLHLCDAEFNIPRSHALAVCEELIRRCLGERVRWYAYLAVMPFDAELAAAMRKAGCVGINFTGDSASDTMLARIDSRTGRDDLANAVAAVPRKRHHRDDRPAAGRSRRDPANRRRDDRLHQADQPRLCGGVAGHPCLSRHRHGRCSSSGKARSNRNPGLRRKYTGPIDLFLPTFYISPALGPEPARLIKDLIAGDKRFFEPMAEQPDAAATDHNYNDNTELVEAIRQGARGAYWDILRQLRTRRTWWGPRPHRKTIAERD